MTSAPFHSVPIPWWVDHLLVPIVFIFFGAVLGFSFGRLKDRLDERKARQAFLRAVRVELSTIREHLYGTLKDATEYSERLEKGDHNVLYLVTNFQTTVYTSQLGKLKDVSDPLVFEVLQFYDKLSNLERIKSHQTSASFDLTKLTEQDAQKEGPLVTLYRSGLNEVIKRIKELLPAVESLIAKLPL
jgi:hypothetical protein